MVAKSIALLRSFWFRNILGIQLTCSGYWGSGSTGYACVAYALKAGFCVPITVRRESAIKEFKSATTAQIMLTTSRLLLCKT